MIKVVGENATEKRKPESEWKVIAKDCCISLIRDLVFFLVSDFVVVACYVEGNSMNPILKSH